MKVLIGDKFEESGIHSLQEAGCEVIYDPELKEARLAAALKETGAEVLVVRSTKVTSEMFEAPGLSLVVRAGAGFNTIDIKAAASRGVYVSNCPGRNSIAVAELAFGLLLALDRRIADNVEDLRRGEWNKAEYSQSRGLFGRTLAIVGLGQIGREMITRAQAFGMSVIGWSRRLSPETAADLGIAFRQTVLELANECDAMSIHLALTPETRGVINAEIFNAMKPGTIFINTSRAEVVDQTALTDAIKNKGIHAGLDVFHNEPAGSKGVFADSIVGLPGVYGTHHIGASTEQAQEAIAAETVRIIRNYKETGTVPNVVNLSEETPATHLLIVRHHDRPGVLAHVLNAIKAANINVQEMENIVFKGAVAAVARIGLDSAPPISTIEHIRNGNPDVIDVSLLVI